jgi:hypothetical protein
MYTRSPRFGIGTRSLLGWRVGTYGRDDEPRIQQEDANTRDGHFFAPRVHDARSLQIYMETAE